jgi:hypothetical protein
MYDNIWKKEENGKFVLNLHEDYKQNKKFLCSDEEEVKTKNWTMQHTSQKQKVGLDTRCLS